MSTLFISDLQNEIAALPAEQRQPMRIYIKMNEQDEYRQVSFEVPAADGLKARPDLMRRYILAMMNNMVVSFGGEELRLYYDTKDAFLDAMVRELITEFHAEETRNDRSGYGVYVNYMNRMNRFLQIANFSITLHDLTEWTEPQGDKEFRIYRPDHEKERVELLKQAATELGGKNFCSLDVGGNSIKGAVVSDGNVAALWQHSWCPTYITTAEEMNEPLILMVRALLAAYRVSAMSGQLPTEVTETATTEELVTSIKTLESSLEGHETAPCFDAIVIGYPDIIVNNKIAGGESYKQKGMKYNPDRDFEIEFYRTSDLDDMVRGYAKEGAPVVVLNDGNAASFINSVEQAFSGESILDANGLFANPVGTEMGTGFISRGGTIQYIPLEGYQHVIDLGSEEAWFESSDIRSVRSTNTEIPGVVQKYISQMGLFRQAVAPMWERRDPALMELMEQGLVSYDEEKDELLAVKKPVDMRGKLTRALVGMLEDPTSAAADAYRAMGHAMGVLIDQDLLIFPEIAAKRLVSGGIVANDKAFAFFEEGMKAYNPSYEIIRLDEDHSYSPLLKSLNSTERSLNVAIGSAYIGNYFLLKD